jgi:hypothetical protein
MKVFLLEGDIVGFNWTLEYGLETLTSLESTTIEVMFLEIHVNCLLGRFACYSLLFGWKHIMVVKDYCHNFFYLKLCVFHLLPS